MRQNNVPFEVVKALLDNQNSFNEKLIQLLGEYLEKTAIHYRDALNPPLESSPSVEMSYTGRGEEAEDLWHQIETGQIDPSQITGNMKKILADADLSIETN